MRLRRTDPLSARMAELEAQVRVAQLETVLTEMRGATPQQVPLTGAPSPFVETGGRLKSLFRKRLPAQATEQGPPRTGYVSGIPIGGATATNSAWPTIDDSVDRQTRLSELMGAYLTCPWSSACTDVIARTITAGGLTVVPLTTAIGGYIPDPSEVPKPVQELKDLLAWCNPYDDIRQLMRKVVTDLCIFGDSYTEVTEVLGKPFALWPLDATTMDVLADEHGIVTGYHQQTETGREAWFTPEQIIHVRMDAPGGGLYGVSPTQKALVPIMTWLFAAGLVKETMRKGDPPRLWIDWPITLPEADQRKGSIQYMSGNLGAKNIGKPFETKGGALAKEFSANKIEYWLAVLDASRDEILATHGVPPSKVSVIESGNLGGGTGTSQDKGFRVNTCGPIMEIIVEKFGSRLLYQAYGITDWALHFGEVDWRDDEVIETIRDMRIRNGIWTRDRAAADVGEPPVAGGDIPFIVNRQDLVPYDQLGAYGAATVAAKQGAGAIARLSGLGPDAASGTSDDPKDEEATPEREHLREVTRRLRGPHEEAMALSESYRRAFQARRRQALKELPRETEMERV